MDERLNGSVITKTCLQNDGETIQSEETAFQRSGNKHRQPAFDCTVHVSNGLQLNIISTILTRLETRNLSVLSVCVWGGGINISIIF